MKEPISEWNMYDKVKIGDLMPAFELLHGDCLQQLTTLPAASVDAVVCDPPYGLRFMGKDWDHGVPGVAFWSAALRVAKPGAHLLAFGGTRTFHRLAVAIEDAGWEIRDCVMWVYGCLSDDTEVLTSSGWERYHIAKHKEILVYDPQTDVYQWEKPSRWSEYRVESDTAYRIVSDSTDQIVSRNHRCLVERGGVLAFVAAEECAGVEQVPYLRSDVSALPQRRGELLLNAMLREGEGLAQKVFSERHGKKATRQGVNGTKEPSVERRSHIFQTEGQVRRPVNQIRSMPIGVKDDGTEGRLRHGASPAGGCSDGATAVAERVCTSHQLQRNGQQVGELDVVCVERRPQAVRTQPSYLTTLATVTPIKYTGLIFCPTVSTGAFVARRNGKVFITGNSGFPKSHNVSKGIDKAAGAEREVVGIDESINIYKENKNHKFYAEGSGNPEYAKKEITAPATAAAQQWDGWGTALKPAWEPIIVARKPLDGTVANNVLTHGTGAINIDGCRVGNEDTRSPASKTALGIMNDDAWKAKKVMAGSANGRFPANLIHDGSDYVLEAFAVAGERKSCNSPSKAKCQSKFRPEQGEYQPQGPIYPGDTGSAARFFYCAKASKADRDDNNHHPTVKPTALMRYLCKLVTPPAGTVLDPFMGSGSTGKAAVLEGFNFIGIEKDAEYIAIARARIASAISREHAVNAETSV